MTLHPNIEHFDLLFLCPGISTQPALNATTGSDGVQDVIQKCFLLTAIVIYSVCILSVNEEIRALNRNGSFVLNNYMLDS